MGEFIAQYGEGPKDDEYNIQNLSNQIGTLSVLVFNITDSKYGAVGDGVTDCTTAIQNAINDAYSAGGGTVVVPSKGTFIFTSINVKANVIFKSLGGILKLKDNTLISSSTAYYLIHNMNSSGGNYNNVTIDSLVVDANAVNNTLSLVGDSITVGGENVVVKNCHLYNTTDSGIMFSAVQNSLCIDNRIDGTGSTTSDCGIYVNDGNNGNSLLENVISGNRITGFMASGIALKRVSTKTVVSDNTIYNCGNGITLEQASTTTDYSKNISIVSNRIRHIGYINSSANKVGINLRESDYSIVAVNRIDDCINYGISIEGSNYCNVSNNVISCPATGTPVGINVVHRDTLGNTYNVISGNIVNNPIYRGIWLAGAYTSQYNVVTHNICVCPSEDAMRVEAHWINNNISDNTLNGANDVEYFSGAQNRMFNNRYVNSSLAGNVGDYNSTRFSVGKYHLWVDSTGLLRIKGGNPLSDTDGTPFNLFSQSSTSSVTVSGGTIPTSGLSLSRVSPTSAVTNCILQPGSFGGQEVTVVNEAASVNSVTFNATGSNVADNSSDVISGGAARKFVWDSVTSLWYRIQ